MEPRKSTRVERNRSKKNLLFSSLLNFSTFFVFSFKLFARTTVVRFKQEESIEIIAR